MEVCKIRFRVSKVDENASRVLFETPDPLRPDEFFPVIDASPEIIRSMLREGKVSSRAESIIVQSLRDQGLIQHLAFKISNESVLTMAARARICFRGLRSNVDAFSDVFVGRIRSSTGRIIEEGQEIRMFVGRFNPTDRLQFLARRTLPRIEIRKALDEALEFASTSDFRFNAQRGREALGHRVSRDSNGLAPDFNPTPESIRDDIRRQLFEEEPGWMIEASEEVIEARITRESEGVLDSMNGYLFGGSPDTGVVEIVLTNSRHLDEIAAARALAAKIRRNNPGIDLEFPGLDRITPDTSNTEVARILSDLKRDRGITLHHSGKVGLNDGAFHTCEIQFIRREAHSKVALVAVEEVFEEAGELMADQGVSVFQYAFENLLGHVGGCYVYRLANGTRYMR